MPSDVSSLNCGSVVVVVADWCDGMLVLVLVVVLVMVGGSTVREDDVSMSTSLLLRGWANDDSPDSYSGTCNSKLVT